jgi:hypothetical protein
VSQRELPDWLSEFVRNTEWGEPPQRVYFWVGVAAIAAALQRRVWIDMGTFQWLPNLYTVIVGPPGIINKSTTCDLGFAQLLYHVKNIHFGASTLTWQSLYDAFTEVHETIQLDDRTQINQNALVIVSREFGNTINPTDTELIDQLVACWDGMRMAKRTRMDGEIVIETPSLNIIGCTTPSWISENVPQYLIGGGLTSRMLFVYADKKERYVAYPKRVMPLDYRERQARLLRDLTRIAQLKGEFLLTEEALDWGTAWYEDFHKNQAQKLDKTLIGGYIARKQTLVHKVAMCLSASSGDSLTITLTDLQRAEAYITKLEEHMPLVYSKIGMSKESSAAETIIAFIERNADKEGWVPWTVIYRYMHKAFPNPEHLEDIVRGLLESGQVKINKSTNSLRLNK